MHRKHLQVFLILIVLLSSCNLPITPAPDSATQTAETATISILISQPAGGTEFPALAPVPVSVQVSGDVQTIELLVDGAIFENAKEPKFNRAKWKWYSSAPGLHTLQARATGEDGVTYTSNSIILWISQSAAQSTTLYQPQTGDTLNGLAERFNTTPELILNTNPFLPVDFSAPLPLERPVKILNRYPDDVIQAFPKLDFPGQPQKDTAPESAFPQTNFPPNAKLPFDNNTPPLSPELVFIDQTYYYISLDGSPWSRVPRNQGEFIKPKNGFFDLDEVLAPLLASAPSKDIHVTIDAWGWQGGSLVYIGRFDRIIAASADNKPWVVLPGQLAICDAGTNCSQGEVTGSFAEHITSNGGKHTLRWQAPPGAGDGLWQTSTQPFGSTCELEPAYLYTSGHVGSAGSNSTFTAEFPEYYGEELTFYARVIPIINGQPDCTPSNTATLKIKAPANVIVPTAVLPPPPPVAYDIEITDFKPIHFPDYDYRYCVTITENPYYDPEWTYNPSQLNPNDVLKTYWYLTAPGTNLCPAPYVYEEPSTWEKVTGFLKDAINTVAAVYNTLKGFVVDIIAEYNPICLQANLITESQAVKDACHAVAEVAVNAALTYVGLPPSLPNYDELIEKGKGELTELIAEQIAEQSGVPCPEECKELIREGIDATVAEVESQFADSACMGEQEAHDNGIEPLCLPPEVKAKPMHEGQLEPAVITVQLTRRADASDSVFPDPQLYDTSCAVNVSSFAENNSWSGQQVFIGTDYQTGSLQYWQGTSVSGQVFKNVHVPVPQLAPGESTSLTFALTEKRGVFPPGGDGFWLPGREEIYAGHYYGSQLQNYYGDMYDDWQYLYFGSTTTMTANATCSTGFVAPPAGATPLSQSTSQTSDEWISQIAQEGE